MSLIYVVEDNPHLLNDTVEWLKRSGHTCYGAADALAFDKLMVTQTANVVILDWMLPGEDGYAIANRLRESDSTENIGIIFLTARSDINDRVSGLNCADAYLTKPVYYDELTAVIKAINRRIRSVLIKKSTLSWQLLISKQLALTPSGKEVSLSWRECSILTLLAQNPMSDVSVQAMVSAIQEEWLTFEKSRLEMMLSRLRSKLKQVNGDKSNPIRVHRNHGYRLLLPFEVKD